MLQQSFNGMPESAVAGGNSAALPEAKTLRGIPPVMPLSAPTDAEALDDYEALRRLAPTVKTGVWSSRSDVPAPIRDIVLPIDRTGLHSSNRFHFQARMACDSTNSPSPARSWYQVKFRKGLEASQFYAESPKTALAMRKYIAAQYRPAAAKAQYLLAGARRVYDPCGGWGDRLSAALATDLDLYFARDTNPYLFAGYSEQVRRLESSTQVEVENIGAEFDPPAFGYFDLVLTSPPYYKAEKYGGEEASHRKFKGFDAWLNGFMYALVENAYASLAIGGKMMLTVSDVYADHRRNLIVGPTVAHARSVGFTYDGAIGYVIGGRPNGNNPSSQRSGFAEPVLMFTK